MIKVMESAGASHRGRVRTNNEDRWLSRRLDRDGLLVAVADGMGGEAAGEVAAALALETFQGLVQGDADHEELERAVQAANQVIRAKVEAEPAMEGMGTTLTAALVRKEKALWIHVGDSRLYRLGPRGLDQISRDHRFIQDFLDAGDMTPQEARTHPMRNVLDQCVGCPKVKPQGGELELAQGDVLLLCSDGLHSMVEEAKMLSVISDQGRNPEGVARALVDAALDAGGRDNVTAVVVRVG